MRPLYAQGRSRHRGTCPSAPGRTADHKAGTGLTESCCNRSRSPVPDAAPEGVSPTGSARLGGGSRDGRPPGFDGTRYKAGNTVERTVDKLKRFRAAATRHDRRGHVFRSTVTAAALLEKSAAERGAAHNRLRP